LNSTRAMIFPASVRATIDPSIGTWICFTEIRSAGAAAPKVIVKQAATKKLLRPIKYLVVTPSPPSGTRFRSESSISLPQDVCPSSQFLTGSKMTICTE
jgi:hypothetical protein